MKDLEEDFNILKKRLHFLNADCLMDLAFEMTSLEKKIEIYFKKLYERGDRLMIQNLICVENVQEIKVKLQHFHQTLDGNFFTY